MATASGTLSVVAELDGKCLDGLKKGLAFVQKQVETLEDAINRHNQTLRFVQQQTEVAQRLQEAMMKQQDAMMKQQVFIDEQQKQIESLRRENVALKMPLSVAAPSSITPPTSRSEVILAMPLLGPPPSPTVASQPNGSVVQLKVEPATPNSMLSRGRSASTSSSGPHREKRRTLCHWCRGPKPCVRPACPSKDPKTQHLYEDIWLLKDRNAVYNQTSGWMKLFCRGGCGLWAYAKGDEFHFAGTIQHTPKCSEYLNIVQDYGKEVVVLSPRRLSQSSSSSSSQTTTSSPPATSKKRKRSSEDDMQDEGDDDDDDIDALLLDEGGSQPPTAI